MKQHSGLQKEVFSLFRRILREAAKKDRDAASSSSASPSFVALLQGRQRPGASATSTDNGTDTDTTTSYAAREFRRQATSAKRSDFKKIEYLIRKGDKQIKLLKMPGVKVVSGTRQQPPHGQMH